ncbi:hypothetical protein [Actinokineospora pegani]|uniref:hypothetical protein n=1 Tax=Actinokineospora pegani TaxID=2654637 RepID=UPI0012EA3DE7|nr:hypothetical protein [Actinokineospora pegani]
MPQRKPVLPPPEPVRPGVRLRAAAETVLTGLKAGVVQADAATTLVVGLAWTAAMGETCQVAAQVRGVRLVIEALASGDLDAAVVGLERVVEALPLAPALPVPRASGERG